MEKLRFLSKPLPLLCFSILLTLASCSTSKHLPPPTLNGWQMNVLVDAGYRLEALDGQEITIVQGNEVGEPLCYILVMWSKDVFFMDALRKRLLATGALQVSLFKRKD